MNKIAIKISLLFFGSVNLIFGQSLQPLSLNEAIDLGIKNSKSLKMNQYKIEEAQTKWLEAKNRQLPELKVSAAALALANAHADIKILPPSSGGSGFPSPNSAYYGSANFSLPLYAGGRINYGIQSTELLLQATKLSDEEDKSALAFTIAQAYNNLYKSEQSIRVLQENLKASVERDKTFLNLEKNGVIARNDRLKANLQSSDLELKLLEAQNNNEIANLTMDILLGLPDNTTISIDSNYISSVLTNNSVQYFLDKALENRKILQANETQQKAATLGLKAAKAENLPQIALTAGYIAAEVPKIMTLYNVANIGIGVQYNLSNIWKKNTDQISSQIAIEKLNTNQQILLDQIKLDINKDYKNYILSENKIDVLEKSVAQANENFRITNNKYKNGLETITNLLEADASQIAANINLLNAKADAILAYKKLEQTSGILISK